MLLANNKYKRYNFEGTIQFKVWKTPKQQSKWNEAARRSIARYCKLHDFRLEAVLFREITPDNLVHLHCTISTDLDEATAKTYFCKAANRQDAEVTHFAAIQDEQKWCHYVTKDINYKTPLLFKSGHYIRHMLEWGNFFTKPRAELEAEGWADIHAAKKSSAKPRPKQPVTWPRAIPTPLEVPQHVYTVPRIESPQLRMLQHVVWPGAA